MLIVCYSFSNGNTRSIAEQLQRATGADIAQIDTVTPYPPYTGASCEMVEPARKEVEAGYCPEIKPLGVNISDYDVIAVGTPTWWYSPAPAVMTFLKANDWNGKTVIPFMTHGGWPGHVIRDIRANCKGAEFLGELQVQYDSDGGSRLITKQSGIDEWIGHVRQELINRRH